MRDCTIGFVPWVGLNAASATLFQWITALTGRCGWRARADSLATARVGSAAAMPSATAAVSRVATKLRRGWVEIDMV